MQANNPQKTATATFAGGCFWCMEPPFEKLSGVIDVISGYSGGTGANPTYQNYAQQGHIEAIQVTYNPEIVSYDTLLDIFWRQIDPTDAAGQFVDRSKQYRTAIFYHDAQQKQKAEKSKAQLEKSKRFSKPIVTEIRPAKPFYKAEEYHQDYYKNRPWRYKWYRSGSGRDQFLEKVWAQPSRTLNAENKNREKTNRTYTKPSDAELRKRLTPLQYQVTQQDGTERAFDNAYWDNKEPGIYVDIVSGEPLFSSIDKFKSGTSWPSFTKPLEPDHIVEREDRSWFSVRTEVRSKHGDSHLGHVFSDGPPPTGLRYCINSASLRFIPVKDLQKEGYGKYVVLFQ